MLKNIFLGAICLLLITTISSCKKSCGINCMHGGFCLGTACSCPDPYSGYNCDTICQLGREGYMCQTLSRDRFFGTWSCTSSDQNGNSKTYPITFTSNSYPTFMNMNNFLNSGDSIICTLTGKYKFDINSNLQDTTGPLANASGSCSLNNGKMTMYINTATNSYFATATMQ
jgi:hypothetical protein